MSIVVHSSMRLVIVLAAVDVFRMVTSDKLLLPLYEESTGDATFVVRTLSITTVRQDENGLRVIHLLQISIGAFFLVVRHPAFQPYSLLQELPRPLNVYQEGWVFGFDSYLLLLIQFLLNTLSIKAHSHPWLPDA